LTFRHPATGKELVMEAEMPLAMRDLLNKL
jgi:hypothetical protein